MKSTIERNTVTAQGRAWLSKDERSNITVGIKFAFIAAFVTAILGVAFAHWSASGRMFADAGITLLFGVLLWFGRFVYDRMFR